MPSPYNPDNPHPLSRMKTELVWEGKYDEYGNRREVDIAGLYMPLQKIETVDQPRFEAAAKGQLDAFEKTTSRQDDFRNMLIWGDNKLVMASLLKDFKGQIDLIYIDPPFDVGADFTMNVQIGDENEQVEKDQSTLEMVAYRDVWGRGVDSYLHMIYERLTLMKELLSERGSIYVHCDWRMNSLLRIILNEIFGDFNFRNELVWQKIRSSKSQSGSYGNVLDTIFFYSKSNSFIFNPLFVPLSQDRLEKHYNNVDEITGRHYQLCDFTQTGQGPSRRFGDKGEIAPPPGKHWIWTQEKIDEGLRSGLIVFTTGKMPRLKRFLDDSKGNPMEDLWNDIPPINSMSSERTSYATQKPELLLERVVKASSDEGDLVADFFCGSGTTGAVAERLNRRWIMADLGRFAIHTSRKRLIDLQRKLHNENKSYRAFDVYNLGRYERQWWQKESLKGADEEHRRVVLEFFRAEVFPPGRVPSPLIHGRKGPALCHVDGIDSVFNREEAREVAMAFAQAGAEEGYCLAWEFEMDLRLTTNALEQELGIKMKLIQIPREIMEKNRKSPPPFLEVAVLEAEPIYRTSKQGKSVDIKLTQFIPSLAEVPVKELEAIKERAARSGFDFIDFWAIDFDWQPGSEGASKPFNHHWQDYRTRKDRSLKTVSDAGYQYSHPGRYSACVKVVDTFGCDTSIVVEVNI